MSAYITLMTPMTDQECLVAAIVDQGIAASSIECSVSPVPLRGWQSDRQANVVLRKEQTGDTYNDIGFLASPTGYTAILSNDYARFGPEWLSRVHGRYTHHAAAKLERAAAAERQRLEEERRKLVEAQRAAVQEKAKKLGYQVKESREGDTIRLVLVKRVY